MTTYTMNLLDLAFTLYAVSHGALELNPAMRCIPFQIFYKVIVVGLLCRWLSRRPEKFARYGLKALTAVYGAVNVWHVFNLF